MEVRVLMGLKLVVVVVGSKRSTNGRKKTVN